MPAAGVGIHDRWIHCQQQYHPEIILWKSKINHQDSWCVRYGQRICFWSASKLARHRLSKNWLKYWLLKYFCHRQIRHLMTLIRFNSNVFFVSECLHTCPAIGILVDCWVSIVIVMENNILQFRMNQRHSKSSEYEKEILAQLGASSCQGFCFVLPCILAQELATWIQCIEKVLIDVSSFFPASAGDGIDCRKQKQKRLKFKACKPTQKLLSKVLQGSVHWICRISQHWVSVGIALVNTVRLIVYTDWTQSCATVSQCQIHLVYTKISVGTADCQKTSILRFEWLRVN